MSLKSKLQKRLHQQYKQLTIKEHRLSYLFLEITRKCNLNCLHCGSDCRSESQGVELTTESWLKIIDYMSTHFSPTLTYIITGGEPLLHPDLLQIAKHIKQSGRRWGIVSNGLLLNPKRMNDLEEAGLSSLTLSVDGLAEAHNKLRQSPIAYRRVLSALKALGESKLAFKDVVTCVYPDNLNDLEAIADLLIEHHITSWRLFRIFPSGRAANNPAVQLTFEQTRQMLNWIEQHKAQYARQGLTINLSCEGWLPFEQDKKVRDYPFFCRSGINMASILADGHITGCSNNHPTFYVGNILKNDFKHLWGHAFDDFRKRDWLRKTACMACEHIKWCNGNSLHLWSLDNDRPNFCYLKRVEDL